MADSKQSKTSKSLSEIVVSYKTNIPSNRRIKITCSEDAERVFRKVMAPEIIEYKEHFYVLCLSRSNRLLGYFLHSVGGLSGTIVDSKQILAIALKANAASIILCHNHPSGNLSPSKADRNITGKIVRGASLLDVTMLDHLILTNESYYSFADEGTMPVSEVHDSQKVYDYVSFSKK